MKYSDKQIKTIIKFSKGGCEQKSCFDCPLSSDKGCILSYRHNFIDAPPNLFLENVAIACRLELKKLTLEKLIK